MAVGKFNGYVEIGKHKFQIPEFFIFVQTLQCTPPGADCIGG